MSYCRFLEGDVYLYEDAGGFICCQWCHLSSDGEDSREFYSVQTALDHIKEHLAAGHKVPARAIEGLQGMLEEGLNLPEKWNSAEL